MHTVTPKTMHPIWRLWRGLLTAWAATLSLTPAAWAQTDAAFRCGGEVEARTWKHWDEAGRPLVTKAFLEDRLRDQGDTYGLYDFQANTHNLVAMAARCGRNDRLLEMARIVSASYHELESAPGGGRGWLCRGGRACQAGSPLKDTEVALTTTQYLALAMRVASALAPTVERDDLAFDYVHTTVLLATEHLNRWARSADMLRLRERMAATPVQARDGQSKWFFTDVDLWVIAIHAELAGIEQAAPALGVLIELQLDNGARESLRGLLQLFRTRLTLAGVESPRLGSGRATAADLDRGYWRHYRDNRYAAYTGKEPPVSCGRGEKAASRVNVQPDSVPLVDSGGWDFSHARRLVHVIDALERQRVALQGMYKLPGDALPGGLGPAFATALVARVWNGDAKRPLFANYWDGSNGWYRAGHLSGGNCFEGYGPSALSDAFALGGFATWSTYRPEIAALGRRLYALSASKDEDDLVFMKTYYPGLAPGASSSVRTMAQLQFWPSLVQGGK